MAFRKFCFIAISKESKQYYISSVSDGKSTTVIWSEHRANALKFDSITAAQTFINRHLRKRADVHIIEAYI